MSEIVSTKKRRCKCDICLKRSPNGVILNKSTFSDHKLKQKQKEKRRSKNGHIQKILGHNSAETNKCLGCNSVTTISCSYGIDCDIHHVTEANRSDFVHVTSFFFVICMIRKEYSSKTMIMKKMIMIKTTTMQKAIKKM